jgi:hypothetical protein
MQPLALMRKWFAGALDSQIKGEKKNPMTTVTVSFFQSPLSPFLFSFVDDSN